MKGKCLYAMLLFLLLTSVSFTQTYNWVVADTNLPIAARYDDISFVNPNLGWAVNSSGQIFKTTDGGNSWTLQLQIKAYFRCVKFADSLTGWAGTLNNSQLLYHTTDGGNHWNLVTNIPTSPVSPKRICGLFVVNENVVYGSGAYDGPAVIIKTTDEGASWQVIDMSSYATNMIDCYFVNKDSGFVVGGSPNAVFDPYTGTTKVVILYTSDGGNTWVTRYTGTTIPEWGWKINFPTSMTGYVSVENFNSASFVKTTDGGISWTQKNISGIGDLEGIGFINENTGWIAARSVEKYTTDGGATWQTVDIGGQINRFQFFGDTLGYASGQTIYKYTKKPATKIVEENYTPESFFLSQNYPNPFNPSTTIQYTLPDPAQVTIRIYDGLGKELRTILDAYQTSGTHKVKWDGKDANGISVASGFYIYRIDAGGKAESKMMVLMK